MSKNLPLLLLAIVKTRLRIYIHKLALLRKISLYFYDCQVLSFRILSFFWDAWGHFTSHIKITQICLWLWCQYDISCLHSFLGNFVGQTLILYSLQAIIVWALNWVRLRYKHRRYILSIFLIHILPQFFILLHF